MNETLSINFSKNFCTLSRVHTAWHSLGVYVHLSACSLEHSFVEFKPIGILAM